MKAQELRDAAATMRARAQAARAGRWFIQPSYMTPGAALVLADWGTDCRRVATCAGSLPEGNEANAEHIASWHPAVALAVADWLESTANDVEHVHDPIYNLTSTTVARALKAARAYLGSAS